MDNFDLFTENLLLRNLSKSTIKSYCSQISLVSRTLKKDIHLINENDLRTLIVSGNSRNLSSSTQMSIINAFKAYFKEIHGRKFDHEILPRPKVEQKQPDILSTQEFQSILDSIVNLKHRTIVCLMYSVGLRVSEVINLELKDIDSKNNKINIRNGKGKIDRVVMLDNSILELMRKYWDAYKTKQYLIEGAKGYIYSAKSIQNIVKMAVKKAGINKKISSHSLRHSCFTQLIKNGTDLRTVQKLAGHKNINTTANYIGLIDSDILSTVSPINSIKI
jgi:site-specific recombinase XerD